MYVERGWVVRIEEGVQDSLHESYDRRCSLDLFIWLKQGWPELVSFFIF